MPNENPLTAFSLHPNQPADVYPEPAPINRPWMDAAHMRHPYRCLPLVIANQCGWVLRNPTGFDAYWYGGAGKEDVELRFDVPGENRTSTCEAAASVFCGASLARAGNDATADAARSAMTATVVAHARRSIGASFR